MRSAATLLILLLAAAPVTIAAPGPAAPEQGYVGFHAEPIANLSDQQKADLKVAEDHGVVVAAVIAKGPGARAGLEIGDRLLRFGSYDVPDLFHNDPEPHHLWRVAMRMMMDNVHVGVPVEVVVERDGVRKTFTVTPVSAKEMHRLQLDEAARELPALADAGAPASFTVDFQGLAADALLPPQFHPHEGNWRVVAEGGDGNMVLRQDRMTLPWAVLLVAGKGRCYTDGTASVRFQPVSGVVDASAGIIFRAQDARNYYVVRPNALEDNFRIYIVKDGVRTQLATVTVTPPETKKWHTLEVTFTGPSFRATVDGKDVVEARDETFASGWCGLWTKADSVTLFDDLKVVPRGTP